MPVKGDIGPPILPKAERDKLLTADGGSWLKTDKVQRQKLKASKWVAPSAVKVSAAEKAEQRAHNKAVVDQITDTERGEGHAKKRDPQIAPTKALVSYRYWPEKVGTQEVTVTVPGKKGVPKYVQVTKPVHATSNPAAIPFDRVFGDEPDPRIVEDITYLDGSTVPRMVMKKVPDGGKRSKTYALVTAKAFNDNVETRTEQRANRYSNHGGVNNTGYTKPIFTWQDRIEMAHSVAITGKATVHPRTEVTRHDVDALRPVRAKAKALARSMKVAASVEKRKHVKLAKREWLKTRVKTGPVVAKTPKKVVTADMHRENKRAAVIATRLYRAECMSNTMRRTAEAAERVVVRRELAEMERSSPVAA
jgi:hypothetical protein